MISNLMDFIAKHFVNIKDIKDEWYEESDDYMLD